MLVRLRLFRLLLDSWFLLLCVLGFDWLIDNRVSVMLGLEIFLHVDRLLWDIDGQLFQLRRVITIVLAQVVCKSADMLVVTAPQARVIPAVPHEVVQGGLVLSHIIVDMRGSVLRGRPVKLHLLVGPCVLLYWQNGSDGPGEVLMVGARHIPSIIVVSNTIFLCFLITVSGLSELVGKVVGRGLVQIAVMVLVLLTQLSRVSLLPSTA